MIVPQLMPHDILHFRRGEFVQHLSIEIDSVEPFEKATQSQVEHRSIHRSVRYHVNGQAIVGQLQSSQGVVEEIAQLVLVELSEASLLFEIANLLFGLSPKS